YPDRFQKQINFLENNKSITICGTQGFWLTDISQIPLSGWQYPTDNYYIKLYLLFVACFGHSSLILRSDFFLLSSLRYNEDIKTCEDWDLWIKVSKISKVNNLSDFLMKYRNVSNSNHRSTKNKNLHLKERSMIISNYWKEFGINLSPEQVFEYYYDTEIQGKDFYGKLDILINSFNKLFLNHADDLETEDKNKFSYMLARKITDFWKRSNVSRYNLSVWFMLIRNVKFISSARLIKSLIKQ
ncbi:hypothetical protein AB9T88_04370, partial [Flavobacterium sp. LBUM151]